jgi:secondary thiamine-phosphate synthase enzyme
METITVPTTKKDQVVDITEIAAEHVRQAERASGVCVVFAAHTTCALTTADLDPGTDHDLLQALRKVLPQMAYRHPHDPAHTPDHILASLIGPSVSVPYAQRRLLLGTWQRIILVELNGPRHRTVHLACL